MPRKRVLPLVSGMSPGRETDTRARRVRRKGIAPGFVLIGIMAGLFSGTAFGQQKSVSDQQIQVAIQRAVASLRQRVNQLDGGEGALITMALLKSGVSADAPEIKGAIEKILKRSTAGGYKPGMHHVYEAGVSLMALANADPVAYKPQIVTIAKFLISAQQPKGFWDYPSPSNGDTSISQYAILGLWEAECAGVHVPRQVWDKAAAWHVSQQLADGSFTYHPNFQQGFGIIGTGSHTMTVAGTASLYVARLHLYPDSRDADEVVATTTRTGKKRGKKYGILEPVQPVRERDEGPREIEISDAGYRVVTRLSAIDKAITRGKEWLADRFTIEPKSNYDIYYLYGLERLAALANFKEIAGRDWYAEGAAHLCTTQGAGAGWVDGCGADPATALGILFLSKATAKMLVRKERRLPERRFGGGLLIGGRGLPDNLDSLQVDQTGVRVRKLKGPVDELLAELENAESQQVESAQAALVETIATKDPEALIGQADRLLKLVGDKRPEVRRTAFWALGRTNDLRVVPTLIRGLNDPSLDCVVEARNALRFISKKIDVHEPPDDPTEAQRDAAIALWKKWYHTVRPYDERDDLPEAP